MYKEAQEAAFGIAQRWIYRQDWLYEDFADANEAQTFTDQFAYFFAEVPQLWLSVGRAFQVWDQLMACPNDEAVANGAKAAQMAHEAFLTYGDQTFSV